MRWYSPHKRTLKMTTVQRRVHQLGCAEAGASAVPGCRGAARRQRPPRRQPGPPRAAPGGQRASAARASSASSSSSCAASCASPSCRRSSSYLAHHYLLHLPGNNTSCQGSSAPIPMQGFQADALYATATVHTGYTTHVRPCQEFRRLYAGTRDFSAPPQKHPSWGGERAHLTMSSWRRLVNWLGKKPGNRG